MREARLIEFPFLKLRIDDPELSFLAKPRPVHPMWTDFVYSKRVTLTSDTRKTS